MATPKRFKVELNSQTAVLLLDTVKMRNSATPITGQALARVCGLTSDVPVRKYVNSLRQHGHPICSNIDGYFWAEDISDIQKTILDLEGRVSSINKAIKGLKGAVKEILKPKTNIKTIPLDFGE